MGRDQSPRKSHQDRFHWHEIWHFTYFCCQGAELRLFLWKSRTLYLCRLWSLVRSLEEIPFGGRGKRIYLLFPEGSWSVDAPRVLAPVGPTDLDNPRTPCQRDTEGWRPVLCSGAELSKHIKGRFKTVCPLSQLFGSLSLTRDTSRKLPIIGSPTCTWGRHGQRIC